MPMTDDGIIRDVVGRMADESPPAPDLDELHDPTVDGAETTSRGSIGRRRLAAVAAAGAVVALAIVALVARPGGDGADPVGSPEPASVAELRGAVESAFSALDTADGVEGVSEESIDGYVSGKVWFTTRPNGDSAVVQQTDLDVAETAWWLTSSEPPAAGVRVRTTAWVVADGSWYEAVDSARRSRSWREHEDPPPGSLALGLALLAEEVRSEVSLPFAPPGADVTRQPTANGGSIWTVTAPTDGGGASQQRIYVHPDGYLASWSWQGLSFLSGSRAATPSAVADEGALRYVPLDERPSITVPSIGTALDLSSFPLPDDFALGG